MSLCSARWLSSNALFLPKQKPSLRAALPARWESMLDTGITDFMRCQVVAQSCLPPGVLAMEVAALCCCLHSVGHGFSVEGLVMIGDCPGEIGGGFPACAGLGRLRTPPHFLRVSPLLLGWTENTGADFHATPATVVAPAGGCVCVLYRQSPHLAPILQSSLWRCGRKASTKAGLEPHRVCPCCKCWWEELAVTPEPCYLCFRLSP